MLEPVCGDDTVWFPLSYAWNAITVGTVGVHCLFAALLHLDDDQCITEVQAAGSTAQVQCW